MREKGIKTYNAEQHQYLREGGKILLGALMAVEAVIKEGVSTLDLNNVAEQYIRERGAEPSFQGYNGFEFAICASVNEESIHGKPRADKVLKNGDIVSVDVGVRWKGMCTDAARTFAVGEISEEARNLINATEQCFEEAIRGLKAKSKVGDIGERIEAYIKGNTTYSIIDTYFGHGIGEKLHEDPLIPNFKPDKKARKVIKECVIARLPVGSVIAIEPMINQGVKDVKLSNDGWTAITADGKLAAHYENTLIIHEDGVEVVTR